MLAQCYVKTRRRYYSGSAMRLWVLAVTLGWRLEAVTGITCFCLGHCPDDQLNGTCTAPPGAPCFAGNFSLQFKNSSSVLRIHENFGMDPDPRINTSDQRVRIKFFLLISFWRYIYILFQRLKVIKKSQNSRNQCFSYNVCLMIEGPGRSKNIPIDPTDPDRQHCFSVIFVEFVKIQDYVD